jgi:cytoskeletal protein CcmA (bactofilin family)
MGLTGIAALLAACGSDGAPSVSVSGSGSGSASASGTVTDFGSVFVNGKKFEAENVEVRRDNVTERCTINPVTTCGFKKGMVVTVNGSFSGNQHTASSVQQKDAVEGLVQSVAANGLSIVVMGQTVLVDNTTIFDNNFTPVVGDNVEVNGHIRPNGIIQATFIEKKLVVVTSEVRGFVNNHASGSATFRIGTLAVNYSGADISDMPVPNGNNWDGRFVEVKGSNFVSATTTLIATKVEPENQGLGNTIDEFEVEGFVTQAGTPNGSVIDFSIGTTPVRTTASTEFRGGTVDEIVVGVKLSAEGRFDGSTLITKHVKFHESVRLEGDATVTGSTLTLTGLPGVTITVNGQTELKDGGNTITVNDLQGNHVRVRGRVIGPNTVVATRIQLRSSDNDVDLQGPVQAIAGNVITILGLSVDASAINQFESVSGTSMSRAGFLVEVRVNSLVKVKGKLSGTTVAWEEAELED